MFHKSILMRRREGFLCTEFLSREASESKRQIRKEDKKATIQLRIDEVTAVVNYWHRLLKLGPVAPNDMAQLIFKCFSVKFYFHPNPHPVVTITGPSKRTVTTSTPTPTTPTTPRARSALGPREKEEAKSWDVQCLNKDERIGVVLFGDSFVVPSRAVFHCKVRLSHLSEIGGYVGIALVPSHYNALSSIPPRLGRNCFVFYSYGRYYDFHGNRSSLHQAFSWDDIGTVLSIVINLHTRVMEVTKLSGACKQHCHAKTIADVQRKYKAKSNGNCNDKNAETNDANSSDCGNSSRDDSDSRSEEKDKDEQEMKRKWSDKNKKMTTTTAMKSMFYRPEEKVEEPHAYPRRKLNRKNAPSSIVIPATSTNRESCISIQKIRSPTPPPTSIPTQTPISIPSPTKGPVKEEDEKEDRKDDRKANNRKPPFSLYMRNRNGHRRWNSYTNVTKDQLSNRIVVNDIQNGMRIAFVLSGEMDDTGNSTDQVGSTITVIDQFWTVA